MHIKIPYKLIEDFSKLEFVAFIVENGDTCISRVDYTPSDHPDFFSKKKKYIEVSDEDFAKCDSIIFYPYYRNFGWGMKLFLRKGSINFVRADGSAYLVKNQNKKGNLDMAKQWLYKGATIPVDDTVIGSKNLIYFSAFGDKSYLNLLRTLLSTLKKQKYRNFDLLFITDKETCKKIEKIRDLKEFNVNYLIRPRTDDPVSASMQKLRIYEYKNIDNYANILFLDLDILVVGDLSKIFEERTRPNVFYSGIHRILHRMHTVMFHRLMEYNTSELERFEKNNIFPFNAGQFFFKNTKTMREHFENINDFVGKWDGEFFFEQSFLNCYFNVLGLSNVFKFKEQFCFVSINETQTSVQLTPDSVFVHFMGSTADGKDKLLFIKQHYSHLL